tara:strand:- start:367 stop:570 length:204 start_codon:yes stop_codon:yes gene_type:complete
MKALKDLKNEFENVKYFSFEVTNRDIADLLKVQYQSTLLIFKNNKEIHRSIGLTDKSAISKVIKSSI